LVRKEFRQFIPFCVVGGIGFVIDAGILALLVHGTGLGPLLSRLVSFPCALTATWFLNRRVTFYHAVSNNPGQEWLRYALVSVAGSLINFIVYVTCIRLSQTMYIYPETALGIAAIVALTFNYLGSSRYAFSQNPDN
jgi:putative flippase GtrA